MTNSDDLDDPVEPEKPRLTHREISLIDFAFTEAVKYGKRTMLPSTIQELKDLRDKIFDQFDTTVE